MTGPTSPNPGTGPARLRVLAVDDERPALDELVWLLERDERIGSVRAADSGAEALRILHDEPVDAIFLDVQMPGLSGIDLARVLGHFASPPAVVFVTAHEEHAVDAFELDVLDYVLKPVRDERLAEAVRRVVAHLTSGGSAAGRRIEESVVVELGGVSRFVPLADILYVEAQGDYTRLHTASGSHLARMPLTTLAEQWREAGFMRIHRSLLVSLPHIDELRMDGGRCTVRVAGRELTVARRHTRALRDILVRRAQPGAPRQG